MSNLPPGVSVSDIPGNRPEDEEYEAFWNSFQKKFDVAHPKFVEAAHSIFSHPFSINGHELDDIITAMVDLARDMGYEKGYDEAMGDYSLVQQYKEERDANASS